jgi:hypothetical protein
MKVTKRSTLTGITHTLDLDITPAQVLAWTQGKLIQDAFPNLSADDREFLLSGSTREEWEQAFYAKGVD